MDVKITVVADDGIQPEAARMMSVVVHVAGIVEELRRVAPHLTADEAAERVANAVRAAWPTEHEGSAHEP